MFSKQNAKEFICDDNEIESLSWRKQPTTPKILSNETQLCTTCRILTV